MREFGTPNIEWRDADGVNHVLVATKNSNWDYLCRATPDKYVTWNNSDNPPVEEPTAEPLAWKHDRAKVTCEGCVAVLDGAVVTKVKVAL